MSLIKKEPGAIIPIDSELGYTEQQIDLIKRTIAKGATNDELALFLYRSKNLGLDPLKPGQIYFIKYGNNPGAVVIGIDGFRARASRTGKHRGTNRGVTYDEKGKLIGAWAEVLRADWSVPVKEEVKLDEYSTSKANWADMPETMIKKVAEAAALRMAFPDELGGLYTKEEMDKAAERPPEVFVEQPTEEDGNTDKFVGKILRGSNAGRYPREIDPEKLKKQIAVIDKRLQDTGKTENDLDEEWKYTYDLICKYLGDLENGLLDFSEVEDEVGIK